MARSFNIKEVDLIMRAQSLFPHQPYLCRSAVRAARRSWVRAIQRHHQHRRGV